MKRSLPTDSKKAVGYIRVSKEEQRLSPEAQRKAMVDWCDANGIALVVVHEDIGVSGGDPLDKRPGLLAALDALPEHGAGVLVVAKRDRLARDAMVAAMVERLAERESARVVSADGVGNGDSPEAQLMRGMIDLFAQYERAILRARVRAALAVKKAKGEKLGGLVPYGFALARDGVHLMEEPSEQKVIRRVVELRARGLALRAVAAQLETDGVRPRTGRKWHPQAIARIEQSAERSTREESTKRAHETTADGDRDLPAGNGPGKNDFYDSVGQE